MRTLPLIICIITSMGVSSWMAPTTLAYTATVSIGNTDIVTSDHTSTRYVANIDRSTLKDSDVLVASMTFAQYPADGSTRMVIITNEQGKTITGIENTSAGKNFDATLPLRALVSNEDFKNATLLNVFLTIEHAKEASINKIYLLAQILVNE